LKRPIEAVNNIARHLGLTEEKKRRLLMRFSEPTKYGLINAITNLARQVRDVEEQIRLEEFGGIGRFWSTCEGFKARDEPRTAPLE
jgi:hypothetical protein